MDTFPRAQDLKLDLPLAPTVALVGGVLIALSFLIMPAAALERLVGSTGLPVFIAAAEPPLGFTARTALALLLGGGFAAFSWFGLAVLAGDGTFTIGRAIELFRRRDIHPDAPPRPPLSAARDLGTPFLEVKAPVAERDLPADLDRPMAEYDPNALLDVPLAPPEPVAPLVRPSLIDPGDRFETFELTPVARSESLSLRAPLVGPAPIALTEAVEAEELGVGPETEATVHDLLARLERGLGEPDVAAKPTLEDTLSDLRRMATGGC